VQTPGFLSVQQQDDNIVCYAVGAEVWWCSGRLLDYMPPCQVLVLSSGIWLALLLVIRCLWRHNITWYSRL